MFAMMNLFTRSTRAPRSPYLTESNRLGDVIAAIQVMATYKFYKTSFEDWSDRIAADKSQADKWKRIFIEHPEFFRLDSARERASLVWRRQFVKRYDVDQECVVTADEAKEILRGPRGDRLSRNPLTASDIKTLIDTAVNLHNRALEHEKDKRWWIPIFSAVGALIGSFLGAAATYLTHHG
jgi:hypothetical protein